jgi:serine/threonine protein kinase/tetratricopeptide (TPR) repeat protein
MSFPPRDSRPAANELYATEQLSTLASSLKQWNHPTQIGAFHILEHIGEGGMGTVYRAEQRTPIHRIVAIKIIKPGMDSGDVIARFEAERQALALMDHPNVARVIDAGTTSDGRPYFVMEHVEGEPITQAADRLKLTVEQRLQLFLQACAAVQHAHQKAIIHRDLKPSNMLVAQLGGELKLKVIDFGVAKALDQRLTEKTLFTEAGQFIGTLEYMSPEQADSRSGDIDTRTDIYSLGVVLYELLSGSLPFDAVQLRTAGYREIQRIISEVDPPRPSTRLSRGNEQAGAVAAARQTDLDALHKLLHRELDWIPLKAMRKDRQERYATAMELADDIENYLSDRPLRAGPESTSYKLRKFLRRHKTGVAASAVMVLLLLAGITATTWQAVRATRAEGRAINQKERADRESDVARKQTSIARSVNELMTGMIAKANRARQQGDPNVTVRAVMDEAAAELNAGAEPGEPEVAAALRHAIGETYDALGLYDAGERLLREALEQRLRIGGEQSSEVAQTRSALAMLLHHKGDDEAAEALYRQVLTARRKTLGEEHPEVARALGDLAGLLGSKGDYAAAEPLLREALAMRRKSLGDEHPHVAATLHNLGGLLSDKGDHAAAEPLLREALAMQRKLRAADSPEVAYTLNSIALVLQMKGDYAGAEALYHEGLALRRKLFGEPHPSVATALDNLASLLRRKHDYPAAERYAREALDMRRQLLGEEHPAIASSLTTLGNLLADQENLDGAEQCFRDALALRRKLLGEEHWEVAQSLNNLASILSDKRDFAGAERLLREALHASRRSVGDDHHNTLTTLANLGVTVAVQGRYEEAEPLLRELYERVPQSQLSPQEGAPYMSFYGLCLVRLNRYEQAEEALCQAYERLIAAGLQAHRQTRAVVASLAEICDRTNRPDEAASWRAKLKDLQAVTQPATRSATDPG